MSARKDDASSKTRMIYKVTAAIMNKRLLLLICAVLTTNVMAQGLPNAPSAQKTTLKKIADDTGWPRTFKSGETEFIVYQPQVDKWEGNRIYLYSAVELRSGAKVAPKYGVVWFNARTEVDKVNRLVTLDNAEVSKVDFPAAVEHNEKIEAGLKARLPGRTKTISLDRLEASVRAASPKFQTVEVKNDAPKIIFTSNPSLLVTIDGQPQLVDVKTTSLRRVMNTSAILLFDPEKKKYYLRVSDWWLQADELDGPFVRAEKLSAEMKQAEESMAEQAEQAKQEMSAEAQAAQAKEATKASLKEGKQDALVPTVYVVNSPAELVETKGEPQFRPIASTSIEYVENSNATILRSNGASYLLISGRWFKSATPGGEWQYVGKAAIPAEFAQIPVDSPMAKVLVSVPGTPQADEALIANSIPQTATITRSEAKLTVVYDGEATFVPIEGTSMTYARNTSAPVIKVADHQYYSVEAGVWFKAPTPQGPWRVAEFVPEVIYTIPASSPLHYVTYAKVYGSTEDVVYVGYTPGYYGTVVSSDTSTVVYGTGWNYTPYVSTTAWYGYPYSYGVGAGFTWASDSGWSFSFGYSYSYYPYYPYYPWWGPMGYYGYPYYAYPYYGYGYGYGYGAWGGAAAMNAYGQWGNTAYSRTAAAWANPYTGNYGGASRGATYNSATGRVSAGGRGYNTNIYTGNTVGYRGGATYNPNTGIVAGGAAGFAGNRYTGQGTAGRGGFAYNTNTGAGIAAGKNNVYAGKDGNVYKYDRNSGNWSQNSGNGWQSAQRPASSSGNATSLQAQQQARSQGAQRTQNFNSTRSSSSFNRPATRSAPMRSSGGRRR